MFRMRRGTLPGLDILLRRVLCEY